MSCFGGKPDPMSVLTFIDYEDDEQVEEKANELIEVIKDECILELVREIDSLPSPPKTIVSPRAN